MACSRNTHILILAISLLRSLPQRLSYCSWHGASHVTFTGGNPPTATSGPWARRRILVRGPRSGCLASALLACHPRCSHAVPTSLCGDV